MVAEQELRARASALAERPYTFTLVRGDDEVWTSGVLEMPGVISEGDDPGDAIEMAEDALVETIISLIELHQEIPEPFRTRDYSGRLQLRLNPDLHRRAAVLATEQGVSLNRWLSQAVARGAGEGTASARSAGSPHDHDEPLRRVAETEGAFSAPPEDAAGRENDKRG